MKIRNIIRWSIFLSLVFSSIVIAQLKKPSASGTGDIEGVTATAPITGGGTSGTVSVGADTGVGKLATYTDLKALKDTIEKAFVYEAVSAGDSDIVYEVRQSGLTLREIRAIRVGGTSSSINATKDGSTDLLTANYSTTTSMASAGTIQNGTMAIGALIRVTIRAISGAQDLFIQFTFDKAQL